MNKAIVFNCHYNGLSIIQELGRRGVDCIAMDYQRSIGTYSRYAKYIQCANPAGYEEKFIEQLYEVCKKEKDKPVLFPTNDIWAQAIAKYKAKLSEVSIPCVSSKEIVDLVLDKYRFYEMGEERQFFTPKTYTANEISIDEKIDFPIIAKPNARRLSSNSGEEVKDIERQMDRLRLTEIHNYTSLDKFLKNEEKYLQHLLFQQLIPGISDQMFTVGVYADIYSNVKGIFTGRKVRGYPAMYGDCILGEVFEVPSHVIENTKKIVKELKYTGIAEFEYKRHV